VSDNGMSDRRSGHLTHPGVMVRDFGEWVTGEGVMRGVGMDA